ncbi:hypothetical protein Taro_049360 [Colocasia esculenta]|uniref:Uncharacterized protein n=1 Tax=Colocasia esculenta TaxID=4460 RepID=A0A843XAQ2_COLES|nr:hypothetical protein [Colocasia esculenta]
MMGAFDGKQSSGAAPPHVLVFPFPLQGHVTPMLKLAEVLSLSGIRVTFVSTERNQRRLLSSASVRARLARRPGLHLRCIPEDFPKNNPRNFADAAQMIQEFDAAAQPRLREILSSGSGGADPEGEPPVTCVVADALIKLAVDVAVDLGVPIIGFRTSSACSFWADQCIPDLIATGVITYQDGCDLDELVSWLPGTESFLRRRDLPSLCRVVDTDDPAMQVLRGMTQNVARYQGIIFNTAEFAEPTVLAHVRGQVSTYPIGPLHGLLQTVEHMKGAAGDGGVDGVPFSCNSTSLLQEDRACMEWLDAKPPASVVYVSFGSIALVLREHLLEIWHGLVNSGYHFLWVVRPGFVVDGGGNGGDWPAEAGEGAKGRGYRVEWAPQEEVLGHPAVGCFLTHSGWNSTIEGLWAGVPMACCPNLADQYLSRRMIAELWKIGVEIKNTCDRAAVEKAVREVMGGERASEIRAAAASMSKTAREGVEEGGSSYMNMERLIQDIRAMSSRRHQHGEQSSGGPPPHVLIFPYPLQSHITPMLKLAEVLSLSGMRVTFLNTDDNQRRLLSSASVRARLARRPGLLLRCIPHGLPDDNPRDVGQAVEMVKAFDAAAQPRFREILSTSPGGADTEGEPPVTCVVADGLISLALDVAEDLGVPIIAFRTSSAFSFWADLCIPDLIATGVFPLQGLLTSTIRTTLYCSTAAHNHKRIYRAIHACCVYLISMGAVTDGCDLDEQVGCVPGSESFLRRRDLPSLCRARDIDDPVMQLLRERTQNVSRYRGVVFNTAEFAESTFLSHIRGQVQSSIYPIGPLHGLLQTVENLNGGARGGGDDGVPSSDSTSLWQEDGACMEWLDARPPASVVYVSFGSLALVKREQLVELWHGLLNSGYHFVWVVRPGHVVDDGGGRNGWVRPAEMEEGTEERWLEVEWAPQQEVLAHPAVGCFLTHSGWNSTLEGVWAGVPMMCWPNFADQHINSRFVSEVWRIGMAITGSCDRAAVEKAVREVMGGERSSEMRKAVSSMSERARECVEVRGSSYMNLERLIRDIRTLSSRRHKVHA